MSPRGRGGALGVGRCGEGEGGGGLARPFCEPAGSPAVSEDRAMSALLSALRAPESLKTGVATSLGPGLLAGGDCMASCRDSGRTKSARGFSRGTNVTSAFGVPSVSPSSLKNDTCGESGRGW